MSNGRYATRKAYINGLVCDLTKTICNSYGELTYDEAERIVENRICRYETFADLEEHEKEEALEVAMQRLEGLGIIVATPTVWGTERQNVYF